MLEFGWFCKDPIDFEHKNYLMLSYFQEVDGAFAIHRLSPYLLWMEKLELDMQFYRKNFGDFKGSLKRDIVGFSWNTGIQYSPVEEIKELEEVIKIIDYSLPLFHDKIQLGYSLNERFPQFLY